MKIQLKRLNNAFHFEAKNETNNTVHMDATPLIEGENKGASPMELLLMGVGGCSAIDIISILKKQKQTPDDINISIDGEREQDKIPALFKNIHIHYSLKGILDKNKVEKAINLSMEEYCSVSRILEKTAKITYSYSINE